MKYIIDICDEPINHCEGLPPIYRAKNFNSLVFDEEDLKRLTPYTERSIPDNQFEKEEIGWNLARRILWDYDGSEIIKMFSSNDRGAIIRYFSYREAKIVIEGYDNHRQIAENVAEILEKTQQCLCRVEISKCLRSKCLECEYHVTDDELIKALAYAISTLKEG